MNLEYRLSVKDYQEAYTANYKSQRTSYLFLWCLSVLVIGLGLLYLFAPTNGSFFFRILGLFFIGCGACLVPDFYYRFFMLGLWKNNPILRESVELHISEIGITYISQSIQTSIKWPVYSHFIETPNLFLIYPVQQVYGVLPKRAFSTREQALEFRRLLKIKLGKRRTVKSR
ncbi:YcxB family protein [Oscillatoriales cyanobacterium LEGE 11467]|uniref:YcxB family protein n=1 Tax=Zarconia navalis LEGE 11467 TaxID=1828826 RepID=A0A928Z904_9CYAN|nr:YcxB family protein [Zarconia navalis]MBE9042085.1 YcxB family protein [Zarconia navalis LEGE 11467]